MTTKWWPAWKDQHPSPEYGTRKQVENYDTDRVMFLRACLGQLQRATAEGVPVDGSFHWSAQDNLEWVDGFGTRFGSIYVDFDTLQRKPKLSAEWFREAARHSAVVWPEEVE